MAETSKAKSTDWTSFIKTSHDSPDKAVPDLRGVLDFVEKVIQAKSAERKKKGQHEDLLEKMHENMRELHEYTDMLEAAAQKRKEQHEDSHDEDFGDLSLSTNNVTSANPATSSVPNQTTVQDLSNICIYNTSENSSEEVKMD